jgi:hypothetical protein
MEKEQKNDEYLYGVVRNYYLMNSKTFHRFPSDEEVESNLKVLLGEDLSKIRIDFKKIKTDVLKQRMAEILKEKVVTKHEMQKLLGVGIDNYIEDMGYTSFSDLRYGMTGKREVERPKVEIFKDNKDAYKKFRDYYVKYLRKHHKFPVIREAKKALKVPINRDVSFYDISVEGLRTDAVKTRLEEIYQKNLDPTKNEITKELGVNIYVWLNRLGFNSFSEMRESYTGNKTRKKQKVFGTNEEASQVFEDYFLKNLREEQRLPSLKDTEAYLKTARQTYFKPGDVRKVKIKAFKRRLEELHEEKMDWTISEVRSKLGVDLDNWPEVLGYKRFRDFKKTRKRIVSMMSGYTIEEKNKKLITYTNLVRKGIKPEPEKTKEEDMWDYVKEKTGKPPSVSDITNVKNYLLFLKEIKGSIINGGYSRSD